MIYWATSRCDLLGVQYTRPVPTGTHEIYMSIWINNSGECVYVCESGKRTTRWPPGQDAWIDRSISFSDPCAWETRRWSRACNATRNTHQQGHALARTVACPSTEAHTRFSRLLRVRTVAFVRRASPTSTHTRTNTVHTLAREREGRRCGCVSHAALLVFSS